LADLVNNYLDEIDEIQAVILNDANLILDAIEIEQLLKDPEAYLMSLGEAFITEHLDEIESGARAGRKMAEQLVKQLEVGQDNS
tara:strand:+ start:64 stop:315 length:252 start_codon:yes stop_codon:yes gene_type:complete